MPNIFDLFERIKTNKASGPVEAIIVGLGNPGPKYAHTRHNVGFDALEAIAEKYKTKLDKNKFKSLIGEANIDGKRVLLLKPLTYMNNSGEAVEQARAFYKLDISNVLVLYDDVSLEPGNIRIRRKGSHGGHNGIKSIIYHTGEDTFPRIKIGVGSKPRPDYDLAKWVLSKFPDDQEKDIQRAMEKTVDGAELIVKGEIEKAMNTLNQK